MKPCTCAIAFVLLISVAAIGCGDGNEDSTSGASEPHHRSGAFILGRWHGDLHQKGMPQFAVSANIRSLVDAKRNTVSYTGIRCAGNWTYRGFKRGAYHLREVIDRGSGGSCKGAGKVTLSPVGGDAVHYEFRGEGVVSRGTLHRRD